MNANKHDYQYKWKIAPFTWLTIGGLAVTLLWVFQAGINELWGRFSEENYSHGSLIPLVVAYLVWQKKELLQQQSFRPSWIGFVVVLMALGIFFIGELGAQWTLVQYSLVSIVIGLHLALMGWQRLKPIIGPLLILYLAIPLPYYIDIILSGKLQLLSSQLGVDIIRLCNIPVYIEGNVIDLGLYKLQVVEACSGLRYLYPLMSIALICAYMFKAPMWKRAIVFISAAPITIFMNSFRIAVVGVLVENYGVEMAEGFVHDFEGWVIFLVCMAILLLEIRVLSMIGNDGKTWHEYFMAGEQQGVGHDERPVISKSHPYSVPLLASWILIIALSNLITHLNQREDIKPERQAFFSFPVELGNGEWQGARSPIDSEALDVLGLTDYLNINYSNAAGDGINLYIGYHESQRKGVTPHSPRACIPGGGWEISSISNQDLKMADGSVINYNRMLISKAGERQLVYYWFQQRGRTIAKEYLMKWYLFYDAMTKNRTDGSLVRLITNVDYTEKVEEADARLKAFAREIDPFLPEYVPD